MEALLYQKIKCSNSSGLFHRVCYSEADQSMYLIQKPFSVLSTGTLSFQAKVFMVSTNQDSLSYLFVRFTSYQREHIFIKEKMKKSSKSSSPSGFLTQSKTSATEPAYDKL